MSWKKIFLLFAPPLVANAYKYMRSHKWYRGRYSSWSQARQASSGYDADSILQKALIAVRSSKMKNEYVRDGVIQKNHSYPHHVSSMLFRQAALSGGRLSVLDFGGSLGTTYFQLSPLLNGLKELSWNIVEQENHVRVGMQELANEQLRFYSKLEDVERWKPNVLLLSSVLQYLPDPYKELEKLLELGIPTVIVDRTPFSTSGEEYLTVQHVPKEIHEASYPVWIFSMLKMEHHWERHYSKLFSFENEERLDPKVIYRGYGLTRR